MKKTAESVDSKEKKAKKTKKKKGFSFCGCFLTVFIVLLVLVVGAAGVGIYFANDYVQKNFDMSIWDTFSVVGDLYSAPKNEIVTNAPQSGDEQAFYDGVGEALLLKEGVIDEDFIDEAISSLGTQQTPPLTKGAVYSSGGDQATNALAQRLSEVLKRENIDMDKLAKFTDDYDYDANYDNDFILEFSDRQITTVFKKIITIAKNENTDPMVAKVFDNLSFEQLILDNDGENVTMLVTADINVTNLYLMHP